MPCSIDWCIIAAGDQTAMNIFSAVVLGGLVIFGYFAATAPSRKRKSLNLIGEFQIGGQYLTGIPAITHPLKNAWCIVTESDFIIYNGFRLERELARILRCQVQSVHLDDRTSIKEKITVERLLTLGIFAMAAPADVRSGELILLLDWTDANGNRQNAIFEFSGNETARSKAYAAYNSFNSFTAPAAKSG